MDYDKASAARLGSTIYIFLTFAIALSIKQNIAI